MCVSDMFNLYKYEKCLYVIGFSGQENRGFIWRVRDMDRAGCMGRGGASVAEEEKKTPGERTAFAHPSLT